MTSFWISAAALSLVAAAFLIAPAWFAVRSDARRSLTGIAAGLALIPAAGLIYLQVTTFDREAATAGPASSQEIRKLRQLAARLEAEPDDAEGWRLLGRGYMALGEHRLARDAFSEAWERTPDPDSTLMLSLGEAMIWTDPATALTQAGDLIEEVLHAEPGNQRALWWGGLVAAERGEAEAARQRWTALLETGPPPDVANLLRRQLSLLPAQGAIAATDGPELTVRVGIAEHLTAGNLGPNSYVFIFARAPGGGPPIAGLRVPPDALPGTFKLSDANAIIAGRSLAAFDELAIVARVSVSGDPIEQPGDLVAETVYRAGDAPELSLTIDTIVGAQ